MNPCDHILFQQLPVIRKIIEDETWLEAERRGCHVTSDDCMVRDRVCQVILRVGQQLRESLAGTDVSHSGESPADEVAAPEPPPPNRATDPAQS
jgi:hypothetical protein